MKDLNEKLFEILRENGVSNKKLADELEKFFEETWDEGYLFGAKSDVRKPSISKGMSI